MEEKQSLTATTNNREDEATLKALVQRLVATEEALQQLGHHQIDAVLDPMTLVPFLLPHSQKTLHNNQKWLQFLIEYLPEGAVLLDEREQRILYMNALAQEHLSFLTDIQPGDKLEQLGGHTILEIAELTAVGNWIELTSINNQQQIFEVTCRRVTNVVDSPVCILMLREVSKDRTRQHYLHQKERLAAIGQLAAGIAHDFNNILAAIVLYTQLLQQTPHLPGKSQERLSIIYHQTERAARLVRQILDFSRQSVLTRQPITLIPFLYDFMESLDPITPPHIFVDLIHDNNEYTVNGDPVRLRQCFKNLVGNAFDAMPDGGKLRIELSSLVVRPEEKAPVADMTPGHWIRLVISDTGSGIPTNALPHIFEPFFTTKSTGHGVGLGLAQAYGIVRQHNGYIVAENNLQGGATFTVFLPGTIIIRTIATELPGAPGINSPEGAPHPAASQKTILLIEDDEPMREAVRETLESIDGRYRVFAVANGQMALALFAKRGQEIDLVLSDMVMPGISGVELYHLLERQQPGIKMIIITGYPLNEGKELLEQGIVAWVQKPFRTDEIIRVIEAVLSSTTQPDA